MQGETETTQVNAYSIAGGICNSPQRKVTDPLYGDAGCDAQDGERDEGCKVEADDKAKEGSSAEEAHGWLKPWSWWE